MLTPEEQKLRQRARYFRGIATDTVVGYLLHDKTYNSEDKLKILEIAKSIARAKGYHRVTWSDFATAINEFRRNKK